MKDSLKKGLLKGLGLSKRTVKEIENEVKKLGKQYGWTIDEAKGMINDIAEEGMAAKDKILARAERIKKKAKISRRTKRMARKVVRKVARKAAKNVRKAGKILAKKALSAASDLEKRLQ